MLKVSRVWALEIAERHKPWISSLRRTDRLGSLSEAREILKAARHQAERIAPNMPQHQACLDAIQEGVNFGGYAGVLKVCMRFFLLLFIMYMYIKHYVESETCTTACQSAMSCCQHLTC